MNATLKAICSLLKSENAETQHAAAVVLDRIHPRESGVCRALGEALLRAQVPEVRAAILTALQHNPHEQSIKFLVEAFVQPDIDNDAILAVLAEIGPKAVDPLKKMYSRMSHLEQQSVARVLPRIRSELAIGFWVDVLFNENVDVVRVAVQSLREAADQFERKQRTLLLAKLEAGRQKAIQNKNRTALSAVLIAFGIVRDPSCYKQLLVHVAPGQDPQVRHHALISLSRLEYGKEGYPAVWDALLPILSEDDYPNIVRYAVETLLALPPRRTMGDTLRKLLSNPHAGVKEFALKALAHNDTMGNAREILAFLNHGDFSIRKAASGALCRMSSSVDLILRELDASAESGLQRLMVEVLEHHEGRVRPETVKTLTQKLFAAYEAKDDRYLLYRQALLRLKPEIFRDSILEQADTARKKKIYARERDFLKLLDGTDFMTGDLRYRLVVAKLKTSAKELSLAKRSEDLALKLVAMLLKSNQKAFVRKFLAEPLLDAADLYYVGYHFSERLNEERRFGIDVLMALTKRFPRTPEAKTAHAKLKVEGQR